MDVGVIMDNDWKVSYKYHFYFFFLYFLSFISLTSLPFTYLTPLVSLTFFASTTSLTSSTSLFFFVSFAFFTSFRYSASFSTFPTPSSFGTFSVKIESKNGCTSASSAVILFLGSSCNNFHKRSEALSSKLSLNYPSITSSQSP